MVSLLEDNLAATAEQLGDPSKESKEELADRHERTLAATLLALAALADVAAPAQQSPPSDKLTGTCQAWLMRSATLTAWWNSGC